MLLSIASTLLEYSPLLYDYLLYFSRIVLNEFSDIIRNIVEALNDITKPDDTGAPIE